MDQQSSDPDKGREILGLDKEEESYDLEMLWEGVDDHSPINSHNLAEYQLALQEELIPDRDPTSAEPTPDGVFLAYAKTLFDSLAQKPLNFRVLKRSVKLTTGHINIVRICTYLCERLLYIWSKKVTKWSEDDVSHTLNALHYLLYHSSTTLAYIQGLKELPAQVSTLLNLNWNEWNESNIRDNFMALADKIQEGHAHFWGQCTVPFKAPVVYIMQFFVNEYVRKSKKKIIPLRRVVRKIQKFFDLKRMSDAGKLCERGSRECPIVGYPMVFFVGRVPRRRGFLIGASCMLCDAVMGKKNSIFRSARMNALLETQSGKQLMAFLEEAEKAAKKRGSFLQGNFKGKVGVALRGSTLKTMRPCAKCATYGYENEGIAIEETMSSKDAEDEDIWFQALQCAEDDFECQLQEMYAEFMTVRNMMLRILLKVLVGNSVATWMVEDWSLTEAFGEVRILVGGMLGEIIS